MICDSDRPVDGVYYGRHFWLGWRLVHWGIAGTPGISGWPGLLAFRPGGRFWRFPPSGITARRIRRRFWHSGFRTTAAILALWQRVFAGFSSGLVFQAFWLLWPAGDSGIVGLQPRPAFLVFLLFFPVGISGDAGMSSPPEFWHFGRSGDAGGPSFGPYCSTSHSGVTANCLRQPFFREGISGLAGISCRPEWLAFRAFGGAL